MKVRYLKFRQWAALSLMGLLGFTSCQSHKKIAAPDNEEPSLPERREEMRLMYGVPTMDYTVRGQVRNGDGKPVEGITVNLLEHGIDATPDTVYGDPENVRQYLESTAVKTDRQGRFVVKDRGVPRPALRLLVRDTDGPQNGEYRNRIVDLDIAPADVDRSQASGWRQGSFDKEVDIRLETKKDRR